MYKAIMHLADYMVLKKLSDDDVADGIDCTRPTVSRIRRRLVRPDWKTIEKIRTYTKGASTADDYMDIGTSPISESAQ
jgi:transcriptional regulator with XRE-family HTH domain